MIVISEMRNNIKKHARVQVLDVDVNWRMHMVSDGQRRRVQICVGLLKPFKMRAHTCGHGGELMSSISHLLAQFDQ